MQVHAWKPRIALVIAALAVGGLALASPAAAATKFKVIDGYDEPSTPANLDKVGILKVGSKKANNVLVLNPGTSASAAYFRPLASFIAREKKGWQVWAIERRENFLEDQSVFNKAKKGQATEQEMFDYYLGYITDPSISPHFQPIPDSSVEFAKQWGMKVAVEDARRVVTKAEHRGGKVVLGGHSLGGSITTAYATWDFDGKPGAKGLSGLVYIDGGSGPAPISAADAQDDLDELDGGSPWLVFGGIPSPFTGLFNEVGSIGVTLDPNGVGALQGWPLLPADLKPPVTATNEGSYGYALDVNTSPPGLVAAQAHLGRLAATGDPRPWERAGALTPVRRYAKMFAGAGLKSLDGTGWYHPQRLTDDAGAVADGNANAAQQVLDVHSTHGADLGRGMRIYAFGAALGGERVLTAAETLAEQSGIPGGHVKLVDRSATYAHNDPNSAYPKNAFVSKLLRFLGKV